MTDVRHVDPKPYRRSHPWNPGWNTLRTFGCRWCVEFWTWDGDHDFRYFYTRRGADRWVTLQIFDGVTVVGER